MPRKLSSEVTSATSVSISYRVSMGYDYSSFHIYRLAGSGDAMISEDTSLPLVNWSHVTDLIHPVKLLLRDTLQEVASNYQIKVILA